MRVIENDYLYFAPGHAKRRAYISYDRQEEIDRSGKKRRGGQKSKNAVESGNYVSDNLRILD